MSALPYMQLYVADYLADTSHLSAIENGAYLLLIMNYWQRGKALPCGDEQLARVCRLTPKEWRGIKQTLCEFFDEQDGFWFHERIESELAKVREKSIKASNAGKVSAQRKANTPPTDDQQTFNGRSTNVEQTLNHTDTDTDKKINNNSTPLPEPRAKAGLCSSDLEKVLKAAAGWEQEPHPGLCVTGIIQSVIEAGASLEHDVLPIVRAIAPKANSRTSWKFFIPAIRQSMNDRASAGKPLAGKSEADRAAKKAAALKMIEENNKPRDLN